MTTKHTVLVTGATGRLGRAVCATLVERGHQVRATDQRYRADFPTHIEVGDLRDEFFVHRMVDGSGERFWERASARPEFEQIEQLLGFHPLERLRRLLSRDQ